MNEKELNSLLEDWIFAVKSVAKFPKKLNNSSIALINFLARQEKAEILYLWEAFTKQRDDLRKGLLGRQKSIVAYLLGFHFPNLFRTIELLRRAKSRHNFGALHQSTSSYEIYDIGCGSGAISQATIASLGIPTDKARVHLLDSNKKILQVASAIHHRIPKLIKIQDKIETMAFRNRLSENPLRIVLLGYVYNELQKNPKGQQKLMSLLGRFQKERSLVLILEPANKAYALEAMHARSKIIELGYKVLYPCPHQGACGLLAGKRDYCYSEFSWVKPKVQQIIDDMIGVSRQVLGCSGYLFASDILAKEILQSAENKKIIVGNPTEKDSPKSDYLICNPDGEITRIPARQPRTLNGESLNKP